MMPCPPADFRRWPRVSRERPDIYILENLEALGGLPPVVFFAALPLKIANGTGSPLRPVAFVPKR
jgi:kynurenine formamidase